MPQRRMVIVSALSELDRITMARGLIVLFVLGAAFALLKARYWD